MAKSTIRQVPFFLWLLISLVVRSRLGDLCVSKDDKEFCAFYTLRRILGCAYTICSYDQISASCTIPSGSPSPPGHFSSYILFALIYCIRLLCEGYVSVSVTTKPKSVILLCLVHSCFDIVNLSCNVLCSYRRYSVSLIRFPFLATLRFSRVKFCLFAAWNVHTLAFRSIFVFWLFLFCWCFCCLYFFWWL